MSEEKKQRTDDESVELGTNTQLAPHADRTKEDTVEKPADGKGFISLDEVYETRGFETFDTLATNCKQYHDNKRLSTSGFTVLKIDGCEGFLPGFDRQNGILGGEGFVQALKDGFVRFIKELKRIIIVVLDWVVGRVRVLLGFEKTERELELINQNTQLAKKGIFAILKNISAGTEFGPSPEDLYKLLPNNIMQGEMFNIIHAKNREMQEQIQKLADSNGRLKDAAEALMTAGQVSRKARNAYRIAIEDLKNAADAGKVTDAHIAKFNNVLEEEVITTLNPTNMNRVVDKLLQEIYNLDVGSLGGDKTLSAKIAGFRKEIEKSSPLVLDPELSAKIMENKEVLVRAMRAQSLANFDPRDIKDLQDLLSGKDAEIINAITAASTQANTSVLNLKYSDYANQIAQYVQHADLLSSIIASVKKTLASLVKWSNNVDRVLTAYVAKDIATIISVQREVMGVDKAKTLETDLGTLGTVVNYDALFLADAPYFQGVKNVWRAEGAKFYKKYAGAFREVNKHLAAIGVKTI